MAEGLRIKVGLELDVGWYLVTEILEEESRKGEGTGSWLRSPLSGRQFQVRTIGLYVHFREAFMFIVDKAHQFATSRVFRCPEVTMYDKKYK